MPLQPRVLGYIGNPVRSIVDAGAAYIIVTEAKQACLTRPQVYILSKSEPYLLEEIFTVDRFAITAPVLPILAPAEHRGWTIFQLQKFARCGGWRAEDFAVGCRFIM